MDTLTSVVSAVLIIELGGLLFLNFKHTQHLEKIAKKLCPDDGIDPHRGQHGMTNFCVWKWEDGWRVIENKCQPGFEPGDPPPRPGAMPNEIVRRPAVRRK